MFEKIYYNISNLVCSFFALKFCRLLLLFISLIYFLLDVFCIFCIIAVSFCFIDSSPIVFMLIVGSYLVYALGFLFFYHLSDVIFFFRLLFKPSEYFKYYCSCRDNIYDMFSAKDELEVRTHASNASSLLDCIIRYNLDRVNKQERKLIKN